MSNPQITRLKNASHWNQKELLQAMDVMEASALLWQGLRDGVWGEFVPGSGKMRGEQSWLLNYSQAATVDDLLQLAGLLGKDSGSHLVGAWSEKADQALQLALQKDRLGVLDRAGQLDSQLQAQLQTVRMIEGEADAVSDGTLDTIAAAYLEKGHLYDSHWVVMHRAMLPKERLARAVVRVLPKADAVNNWNVVEDVVEHLCAKEKVALLVRCKDYSKAAQILAMVEQLDDPRSLIQQEMAALRALPHPRNAFQTAAWLFAQLQVAAGEDIPEWVDEHLRYFSLRDSDLDARLFGALPPTRAAAIVKGSLWSGRSFFRLIDDEGLLEAAVEELDRANNNNNNNDIADAIGDVGERALPALRRGAEGKPLAKRASGIAHALGRIPTPDSAALLVELLEHSSKVVRDTAVLSLSALEQQVAKPALDLGLKSKKKAVRQACQELLDRYQASAQAEDSPRSKLEASAAALPEEVRVEILALSSSSQWSHHIRVMRERYGAPVLVVLRDWFLEETPQTSFAWDCYMGVVDTVTGWGQGEQPADFVPANGEEALAAAHVALDAVAGLPKLKAYRHNSLAKNLRRHFSKWAAGPAAAVLRTRKTPFAEPLYEIAAMDPELSRDLLLVGLSESAKGIRTTCVEVLAKLGASITADVLPLLRSGKKDAREAAAKVLAAVGAEGSAGDIAQALEAEKSDEVRMVRDDARRAAGGGGVAAAAVPVAEESSAVEGVPVAADAGEDRADSAADSVQVAQADIDYCEAKLTKGKAPRLPKWLDLAALPPLLHAGGQALSEAARAALVGRLKKEDERPNPFVAELRHALEPSSRAAFGVATYKQWEQARTPSGDKWALYQLAQLGDESWIPPAAERLDNLTSMGRHALAGWHIEVFARGGTKAGLDWIGYWADNATTDGLQRKSIGMLGDIAKQQGISDGELRARLDPYVADAQAERRVPDYGFDVRGEQPLVYGARTLIMRLGPDGRLGVVAENGKVLTALPRPSSSDNGADVKAAKEGYQQLQQRVKASLQGVLRRFERAMISGRTWSMERFEQVFLRHPLMSTIGTGLVMAGADGQTFRISEERTPIDVGGEEIALPEDAVVRIVHPLDLDQAALAQWGEHLEDADVVQPFEQIQRPTFQIGDEISVPKRKLRPSAFVAKVRDAGWNRGRPQDAGLVYDEWIRMPARGVQVNLSHSGYPVSDIGGWDEDIEVESVYFTTPSGEHLLCQKVDPIAFSEAQYAVQRLFGVEQQAKAEAVAPAPAAPVPLAAIGSTQSQGPAAGGGRATGMGKGFPGADLAPSGRAGCVHCSQKIEKGGVRIVIEREIVTPQFTGKGAGYLHPGCAEKWAEEAGLDWNAFVEEVRSNTTLEKTALPEPFNA